MILSSKAAALAKCAEVQTQCAEVTVGVGIDWWVRDPDHRLADWVENLARYIGDELRDGRNVAVTFLSK